MSEQFNPFEAAMKESGSGADPFMANADIFGDAPAKRAEPADDPGGQPAVNPFDEPEEAQPMLESTPQLGAPIIDLGDQFGAANPFDEPEESEEIIENDENGDPEEPTEPDAPVKEISGGKLKLLGADDAQPEAEDIANPFAAVIAEQDKAGQASIYAKPPIFEYSAVKEPIEDPEQTFEDLRVAKADDFPELEDGIRVSWDVTYGKIRKTVPTPKKTKIGEFKKTIETSKEFMDALKKDKDKSPDCIIKPRVTAQSKGEKMPAYKGVFTCLEDSETAKKVISLVPGRDGKVYEIRREEMGTFITPASECRELSDIKAGFTPALPLVPREMLLEVISFFRSLICDGENYEAIVNVYWDRINSGFLSVIPKQRVTATRADSELNGEYSAGRYIHYMDIHSHNVMAARFSQRDNMDEKATRLYAVVGQLDRPVPEISVRISNGGKHLLIDPDTVFESNSDYRPAWGARASATLACATEKLAQNIMRVFADEGAMCA